MIFGGLEIVAGGYLIHRHYKKKNSLEKQKLEVEAQQRRNNTFPGANPQKPNGWNTQAHHRPSHHQHHGTIPAPQKYTYNAPVVPSSPLPQYQQQPAPRPQPFYQSPPTSPYDARPNRPLHTQSFSIPRRPVPTSDRKPEIIIPAGLQRSDSMATLSRMPIANGSRPSDIPEESSPVIQPPRRQVTGGLEVVPAQHRIYGNQAFSVSSPAFGATVTSPPVVYEMATVDDNWETYGVANGAGGNHTTPYTPGYAPTVSTELGERDPPPPYVP